MKKVIVSLFFTSLLISCNKTECVQCTSILYCENNFTKSTESKYFKGWEEFKQYMLTNTNCALISQ